MSKSKNNGIDPQALIDEYGADTARLFIMFASPPEQSLEWSDAGVEGAFRFLKRVWHFCAEFQRAGGADLASASAADLRADASHSAEQSALRYEVHSILKQANYDFQKFQFNTVVSAAMKILNALERANRSGAANLSFSSASLPVAREALSILVRMLAPITPHVTFYVWRELGLGPDVFKAPWPEPDASALQQAEIELVLQVNGKLRGNLRVPSAATPAADREARAEQPYRAEIYRRSGGQKNRGGARPAGECRRMSKEEPHPMRDQHTEPGEFCAGIAGERAVRWLFAGGLALAVVALSACGFHLSGAAPMPFETLYISAPAYSSFGAELKRYLASGGRDEAGGSTRRCAGDAADLPSDRKLKSYRCRLRGA